MSDHTVARRYANALIEVATEADAIDTVSADLDRFVALLEQPENPLGPALYSPVFTAEERERVLDEVLPRLNLHPMSRNLLKLTNDKGRLPLIASIARAYRDLADARAGRVRVRVATAEPLTPQIETEVRMALERLTGKDVLLETSVDPTLLGGMVARVGSTVYDSSLRTRLQTLKRRLLETQVPGQA